MSSPPRKSIVRSFWFVSLLTLVLAIALLVGSEHLATSQEPYAKFLAAATREAGFACLIAFFLNISVEAVTRLRHEEMERSLVERMDSKQQERIDSLLKSLDQKYQETSTALLRDVFRTVYERNIDPNVFKVVDNHVLKTDLMRKNFRVSMCIRPIRNEAGVLAPDLVELHFHIRYDAVNITDGDIEVLVLGAQFDVTPSHEERCKFEKAVVGTKTYSSEELEPFVKRDEANAMWQLAISNTIPARGSIPIELIYRKVGPRNFSEVICTTKQMDGLDVDVLVADADVQDLQVQAVSLHPETETLVSSPTRPEYNAWRISHAILPGQGMVVFWHPKRVKVAQKQQPAA